MEPERPHPNCKCRIERHEAKYENSWTLDSHAHHVYEQFGASQILTFKVTNMGMFWAGIWVQVDDLVQAVEESTIDVQGHPYQAKRIDLLTDTGLVLSDAPGMDSFSNGVIAISKKQEADLVEAAHMICPEKAPTKIRLDRGCRPTILEEDTQYIKDWWDAQPKNLPNACDLPVVGELPEPHPVPLTCADVKQFTVACAVSPDGLYEGEPVQMVHLDVRITPEAEPRFAAYNMNIPSVFVYSSVGDRYDKRLFVVRTPDGIVQSCAPRFDTLYMNGLTVTVPTIQAARGAAEAICPGVEKEVTLDPVCELMEAEGE